MKYIRTKDGITTDKLYEQALEIILGKDFMQDYLSRAWFSREEYDLLAEVML